MVVAELVRLLDALPPPLAVFVFAALPVLELRGAIPLAILYYGMSAPEAVFWSVLGNILPVVVLLRILGPVERYLRRWPFWDRWFTRLFDRTVRRLDESMKRYEAFGLTLFVAVPLPVTGAWTGAAAAHAFALGYWRSLAAIAVGIVLAAALVALLVTSGRWLWLLGAA